MGLGFETVEDMVCLTGLCATGKTERLVRHAADLVRDGVDVGSILVVTCSPSASVEFGRRLAAALPESCAVPRIATAREVALEILASEEVRRRTGCEARVLLPFEENFLMEDLKVTGVPPKRLREMLKFLYRSLTEMADDDPGWLYGEEEEDVYATLRRHLKAVRAYIEPQVANEAVRQLRRMKTECVGDVPGFDHVVVDDFTLMNASSQILCSLLARTSLWVAGNRAASYCVFDSYPYAAGLEAFAATDGVEAARLDEAFCIEPAVGAQRELLGLTDCGGDAPLLRRAPGIAPGVVLQCEEETPEDDLRAEVLRIGARIEAGVAPEDIYVASQSGAWRKAAVRELERAGIACASPVDPRCLSADERDLSLCVPARAFAALCLVADPADPLAWRTWCGFGDYLLESRFFSRLIVHGEQVGVSYPELLERACLLKETSSEVSEHVIASYRLGRTLIQECLGFRGFELLERVEAFVRRDADSCRAADCRRSASLASLCATVDPEDDAKTLAGRIRERLTRVRFEGAGVRVGTFEQLAGLSVRVLVLGGFVDGSFPDSALSDPARTSIEKRAKRLDACRRLASCTFGKATEEIEEGLYRRADLETATALGISIGRIGLNKGVRVACAIPSDFLLPACAVEESERDAR